MQIETMLNISFKTHIILRILILSFILILFLFCLNGKEFFYKSIQTTLIISILLSIKKEFFHSYLSFSIITLLLMLASLFQLSSINTQHIKNPDNDLSITGFITDSDIASYSYNDNGVGEKLNYTKKPASRGSETGSGFIFIKNNNLRLGFISCSMYTKGCTDFMETYNIKKGELVTLNYQHINTKKDGLLILTSIKSKSITVPRNIIIDMYQNEINKHRYILQFSIVLLFLLIAISFTIKI